MANFLWTDTGSNLAKAVAWAKDNGAETTVDMGVNPHTYGTVWYGTHRQSLENMSGSSNYDCDEFDLDFEDRMIAVLDSAGSESDAFDGSYKIHDDDDTICRYEEPDLHWPDQEDVLADIHRENAQEAAAARYEAYCDKRDRGFVEDVRAAVVKKTVLRTGGERVASRKVASQHVGCDISYLRIYREAGSWKDTRTPTQFLRHAGVKKPDWP